ncbi:JAB domain-containing protein [Alkalibaculum bacchi]
MITRRLSDAGEIMSKDVLDHIIVGGESFVSLKEKGYCI